MFHAITAIFATLFVMAGTVHAINWSPLRFSLSSSVNIGIRTYFCNNNGTIQQLVSPGTPAAPQNYTSWTSAQVPNTATFPPCHHLSNFASAGYTSPATNTLILRVFYQSIAGDIRSAWYNTVNGWAADPTIIATSLPYGVQMSAVSQINSGNVAVIIHYLNANGTLTQRVSTTDAGNWGAPITINTP